MGSILGFKRSSQRSQRRSTRERNSASSEVFSSSDSGKETVIVRISCGSWLLVHGIPLQAQSRPSISSLFRSEMTLVFGKLVTITRTYGDAAFCDPAPAVLWQVRSHAMERPLDLSATHRPSLGREVSNYWQRSDAYPKIYLCA
jgi:hypothetical protein